MSPTIHTTNNEQFITLLFDPQFSIIIHEHQHQTWPLPPSLPRLFHRRSKSKQSPQPKPKRRRAAASSNHRDSHQFLHLHHPLRCCKRIQKMQWKRASERSLVKQSSTHPNEIHLDPFGSLPPSFDPVSTIMRTIPPRSTKIAMVKSAAIKLVSVPKQDFEESCVSGLIRKRKICFTPKSP